MKKTLILWTLFSLILFTSNMETVFAEATSTSYRVTSGTVGCGGGTSTSTSYTLYDSLCEVGGPGPSSYSPFATSTTYVLGSGFQTMQEQPHISVSYSTTTITFGTLSTGAVASSAVTVTVTTNAPNGYVSSLVANNALRQTSATSNTIDNVSDGGVTAGSEEYGFRTSGTNGQYNATDTCVPYTGADSDSPACTTTAKTFASSSTWASADATILTFKAAISTTTAAGSDYAQTITIITTGTF